MRVTRRIARLVLLASGILTLVLAMWGGLLRMEVQWLAAIPTAQVYHGPLMIGGFLGTVIGLERAVALGSSWGYLAPLGSALASAALVLRGSSALGSALLVFASGVLGLVFLALLGRQRSTSTVILAIGAVAWLAGNLVWWSGDPIPRAVPWWIAFLVLTIAGERLDLSRLLRRTPAQRRLFLFAVALYLAGVAIGLGYPGLGWLVGGLGWLAIAGWLIAFDLARRTVRQPGQARFIAVCLLSGYAWLAVAGILVLVALGRLLLDLGAGWEWLHLAPMAGPAYDAILHSVLLGFVIAMIFGHAPIIFPALLGTRMVYSPRFYAHLGLLHASLILRVLGDLAGSWRAVETGGLLHAIAILLFVVSTVTSLRGREATASAARDRGGPS